jgi:hypothetical protein
MTTATAYGVRCGNHGTERIYHATLEEVRGCYRDRQFMAHQDRVAGEMFGVEPDLSAFDTPQNVPIACAKTRQDAQTPIDSDGMYRNPVTGQIFKVYVTVHGAHQRVAKELIILPEADWYNKIVRGKEVIVKATFEYRGKAGLRGLTEEMKMTLEEGKQYGAIYGVCVRCGATLTREDSIERAMGLVCSGKGNWA